MWRPRPSGSTAPGSGPGWQKVRGNREPAGLLLTHHTRRHRRREGSMAHAPRWETAYCSFFEARQRSFMRTAYAMLGSWAAAEDATQQTFTALYVRWPRISPDMVEAYARRVLVN